MALTYTERVGVAVATCGSRKEVREGMQIVFVGMKVRAKKTGKYREEAMPR
jgi:hypothetical protein